jgi:large subunit ribosomal protein L4
MQAQVYNLAGEVVDTLELSDYIFGIEPNVAVLHQAVVRQQANARLGTHNTLTRGNVRGGGRKPYRQKGTGNARQGSRRSPQWRGGGVVFGPHPRSYEQAMPRKMRRLAMRSALSAKARDGQIIIVENLDELEPRTKAMLTLLDNLNLGGHSTLLMLPERMENVYRAAGNLADCKLTFAQYLSLVDMLKYQRILMTVSSLDTIGDILADDGNPAYASVDGNGSMGATLKDDTFIEVSGAGDEDEALAELSGAGDEDEALAELSGTADSEIVADNLEAASTVEAATELETEQAVKPKRRKRTTSPAEAGDAESEV